MSHDRAVPIWPFPGQNTSLWWECYPPHNLPPPRFSEGDRVRTRWGNYSVLSVRDHERWGSRAYHCRPDGSTAPPGFGHEFSESDMEPLAELAAEPDEEDQPAPAAAPRVQQLELFA
jgi:hypothetical protein